jgi:HEAT repeat protein
MAMATEDQETARARRALAHGSAAVRLRAAMAVGAVSDPRLLDSLVERCGVEPDFSVREMLTWALTRYPTSVTVPRLVEQLRSERAQARSQALHTLSKIGDRAAWPAVGRSLLTDPDDEAARSAWRAAVALVPEDARQWLAGVLATQLGRGGPDLRLSLSRALVALGEVAMPVLNGAMTEGKPRVREHAIATERLWRDPDAGFELAIEEAKRIVALGSSGREGS